MASGGASRVAKVLSVLLLAANLLVGAAAFGLLALMLGFDDDGTAVPRLLSIWASWVAVPAMALAVFDLVMLGVLLLLRPKAPPPAA